MKTLNEKTWQYEKSKLYDKYFTHEYREGIKK